MEEEEHKTHSTDLSTSQSVELETKPFWKRHFLKLFLLLLLIVVTAWGYFGKQQTIKEYETKITNLKETHESEIRNIKSEYIKDLANTLALAIRSEMIAENINQIDQYFLQTVKMYDVERILLINHENGEIILSTNKKDQGTTFKNETLLGVTKSIAKIYDNKTYTATPIMGLNSQLAVMVIQID